MSLSNWRQDGREYVDFDNMGDEDGASWDRPRESDRHPQEQQRGAFEQPPREHNGGTEGSERNELLHYISVDTIMEAPQRALEISSEDCNAAGYIDHVDALAGMEARLEARERTLDADEMRGSSGLRVRSTVLDEGTTIPESISNDAPTEIMPIPQLPDSSSSLEPVTQRASRPQLAVDVPVRPTLYPPKKPELQPCSDDRNVRGENSVRSFLAAPSAQTGFSLLSSSRKRAIERPADDSEDAMPTVARRSPTVTSVGQDRQHSFANLLSSHEQERGDRRRAWATEDGGVDVDDRLAEEQLMRAATSLSREGQRNNFEEQSTDGQLQQKPSAIRDQRSGGERVNPFVAAATGLHQSGPFSPSNRLAFAAATNPFLASLVGSPEDADRPAAVPVPQTSILRPAASLPPLPPSNTSRSTFRDPAAHEGGTASAQSAFARDAFAGVPVKRPNPFTQNALRLQSSSGGGSDEALPLVECPPPPPNFVAVPKKENPFVVNALRLTEQTSFRTNSSGAQSRGAAEREALERHPAAPLAEYAICLDVTSTRFTYEVYRHTNGSFVRAFHNQAPWCVTKGYSGVSSQNVEVKKVVAAVTAIMAFFETSQNVDKAIFVTDDRQLAEDIGTRSTRTDDALWYLQDARAVLGNVIVMLISADDNPCKAVSQLDSKQTLLRFNRAISEREEGVRSGSSQVVMYRCGRGISYENLEAQQNVLARDSQLKKAAAYVCAILCGAEDGAADAPAAAQLSWERKDAAVRKAVEDMDRMLSSRSESSRIGVVYDGVVETAATEATSGIIRSMVGDTVVYHHAYDPNTSHLREGDRVTFRITYDSVFRRWIARSVSTTR